MPDEVEIDLSLAPGPSMVEGAALHEMADGTVEVDLTPQQVPPLVPVEHGANLANFIPDSQLQNVAAEIIEGIDEDKTSRQQWEDQAATGMKLMGFNCEDRTFPFNGASGVYDTLMAEAVLRMQAIAYGELLPPNGPVKPQIIGEAPDALQRLAQRQATWMNYYFTKGAPEYYPDFDQMLLYWPLIGSTFKKIYQDPVLKRPVATFIMPSDFIAPYTATALETAARLTNVIRPSVRELKLRTLAGFYRDVGLPPPSDLTTQTSEPLKQQTDASTGLQPASTIKSSTYTFYETSCFWDFEGADPLVTERGLPVPYIVTIDNDSQKVLSVYRNWRVADPTMQRRVTYAHYRFFPGFGFYGTGYAHILGGMAKSATTQRRQIEDSGTLNNFPGGLRVKGMRMDDNNIRIGPMEFPEIDTAGLPIQQAVMTMPYKEPSAVTFQMMQDTRKSGRDIAGLGEIAVGEGRQDAPVGTTMALLEQAMKFQSSTMKRAHDAFADELAMFQELFAEHLPDAPYPYIVDGKQHDIMRQDFQERIAVVPVSDPNITSTTQRIMRAQALLQSATSTPHLHDMREAFKELYVAMGVEPGKIDRLLPPPQSGQPMDPLTENQLAVLGKPLKAAPYQDHQAHIQVHMPLGQTPAMQAHIAEHVAMQMRAQIEALIGRPLPQGPMPPEIENQVAVLVAKATQALQAQQQEGKPLTPEQLLQAQIEVEKAKIAQRDRETAQKAEVEAFKTQTDFEKAKLETESQERVARLRAFGETADNTRDPLSFAMDLLNGVGPFKPAGQNGAAPTPRKENSGG